MRDWAPIAHSSEASRENIRYSIGRPRGFGPRGKALSSAAISSAPSTRSPAAALSAACSALEAFGIANTCGLARQKAQRDLTRRSAMALGDGLQHLAGFAARRRKIIVTERRIGDHRDAVLLAPRNHRMLDRAFLQMIEHLVAGDLAFACNVQQFVEIVGVEIADAPAADFAGSRPVPRTRRRFRTADTMPRQCKR